MRSSRTTCACSPRTPSGPWRYSRLHRTISLQAMVSLADVRAAAGRVRPFIVRTALERSLGLSATCGTDVWLKYECFQTTGSFKLRGALNALLTMSDQQRQKGVLTASAGNPGLRVRGPPGVPGGQAPGAE